MSDWPARRASSYSIDPDPLTVEEQSVRRQDPDPGRSGCVIVWIVVAAVVWLAIAAFVANMAATPRSGPNPTAPPPASNVAGLALAFTVPAASASGSGQSGASHARGSGSMVPGSGAPMSQPTGGGAGTVSAPSAWSP